MLLKVSSSDFITGLWRDKNRNWKWEWRNFCSNLTVTTSKCKIIFLAIHFYFILQNVALRQVWNKEKCDPSAIEKQRFRHLIKCFEFVLLFFYCLSEDVIPFISHWITFILFSKCALRSSCFLQSYRFWLSSVCFYLFKLKNNDPFRLSYSSSPLISPIILVDVIVWRHLAYVCWVLTSVFMRIKLMFFCFGVCVFIFFLGFNRHSPFV